VLRESHRRRTNPLRTIGKTLGGMAAALLGATAGWLGYSAVFIDHNLPLPPAIEAERTLFDSPTAGALSFYADRRGAGRPLVLIHSINAGASGYEMRPLFEQYRGERPVYALDLPGFGFSERSDRAYSPQLYTAAVISFLESQLDEAADVVAFSLSSEFAARAALERPDLISSLALLSPTGFTDRPNENRSERASRTASSDRVLRFFQTPLWSQGFYDLLVTRPSLRYFLQRGFVGPVDEGLVEYAYLATHQPGARYAPLYFISGKLFSPDIRTTVYERLELPVLVMYDRDANIRFDTLPQLLEQRPNWQATRIAPTLGLPHWERRDDTRQALDDFWARTPALAGRES
jgi:pimeloyl-ACP methyl ester carboxylesterase